MPEPLDAAAIAQRLRQREPICTIYCLPTTDGRRFVGASPELLARRDGAAVACHPLAGTIALPPNVAPDDYQNWLLGSAEEPPRARRARRRHRHALLASHYDDIAADADALDRHAAHGGAPRHVDHRGTPRRSRARPTRWRCCGCCTPRPPSAACRARSAYELIRASNSTTAATTPGPWAGSTRTATASGGSASAASSSSGTDFEAWAGAGIVSESDPIAEREETRDKLASVLSSVLVDRGLVAACAEGPLERPLGHQPQRLDDDRAGHLGLAERRGR